MGLGNPTFLSSTYDKGNDLIEKVRFDKIKRRIFHVFLSNLFEVASFPNTSHRDTTKLAKFMFSKDPLS